MFSVRPHGGQTSLFIGQCRGRARSRFDPNLDQSFFRAYTRPCHLVTLSQPLSGTVVWQKALWMHGGMQVTSPQNRARWWKTKALLARQPGKVILCMSLI